MMRRQVTLLVLAWLAKMIVESARGQLNSNGHVQLIST